MEYDVIGTIFVVGDTELLFGRVDGWHRLVPSFFLSLLFQIIVTVFSSEIVTTFWGKLIDFLQSTIRTIQSVVYIITSCTVCVIVVQTSTWKLYRSRELEPISGTALLLIFQYPNYNCYCRCFLTISFQQYHF